MLAYVRTYVHYTCVQVLRLPTAGKLYGMCVSGTRVFVADYERHQVRK